MSSADLARATGIQAPTLSKIELGQRSVSRAFAPLLAQALSVPVQELYASVGSPIPPTGTTAQSSMLTLAARIDANRLALVIEAMSKIFAENDWRGRHQEFAEFTVMLYDLLTAAVADRESSAGVEQLGRRLVHATITGIDRKPTSND